MAWKVITFLAIFALSEARPPTSEQRVKTENWLSHIGSQQPEKHEVYASAYPSYEFTYEVSDPHTHDFKGHHEQRRGDDVKGYYWLIQPDGYKRTVKYHVDKHSGFKAHVDYTKYWEGENRKEEGEGNEEQNNGGENENTEENENGQENESATNENEGEGEGETENNESGVEGGEENGEEQTEVSESENQEGEGSEQQEEQWGWIHGRNLPSKRHHGRREHEQSNRKVHATVGIWHPKAWGKRKNNEESRQVRSGEGNENRERGEAGNSKRRHKGKNEERRQETNKKSEKNEGNGEEQRNEGNENAEGGNNKNHKGEIIKSEYHVVIHHPKHKN